MPAIEEHVISIAENLEANRDRLTTEEATKNALIMPFISKVLGYDVFNPSEVVPEYTAGYAGKKGQKVDYAIMRDGKISILIECKKYTQQISYAVADQLAFYYGATQARIGILTNGQQYQFFTDLEKANVMDKKPFLVLNLDNIDTRVLPELERITKTGFDLDAALSSAESMKMIAAVRQFLTEQFEHPSGEFLKLMARVVKPRTVITQKLLTAIEPDVKEGMKRFLSDLVAKRLKDAIKVNEDASPAPAPAAEAVEEPEGKKIETTPEEILGFSIVQAICAPEIDPQRIKMRDAQSYCAILMDDNNRRPLVRLHFNGKQKRIQLPDAADGKMGSGAPLVNVDSPSDLFKYRSEILDAAKRWL